MKHEPGQHSVWPIEWTPDQVTRFWNWYASRPEIQRPDHADAFASSVISVAKQYIRDFGVVVDYACGLGTLTSQLARRRVRTWGFDVSDASVAHVRRTLSNYPDFLGADEIIDARVPLENGSADTVFLVETIEHLKDDALMRVLLDAGTFTNLARAVPFTEVNQAFASD